MGMTPPALYRYFADRDELLTELIVDAYTELGTAVATARDSVPEKDIGGTVVGDRLGVPGLGTRASSAVRARPRPARAGLRRP
jgi:AcrR family transcriptional regulator